jgi:hypothetical protein
MSKPETPMKIFLIQAPLSSDRAADSDSLTVGELLNVRHPSVNGASVRMDAGAIDQPSDVPITDNKRVSSTRSPMSSRWTTTG